MPDRQRQLWILARGDIPRPVGGTRKLPEGIAWFAHEGDDHWSPIEQAPAVVRAMIEGEGAGKGVAGGKGK